MLRDGVIPFAQGAASPIRSGKSRVQGRYRGRTRRSSLATARFQEERPVSSPTPKTLKDTETRPGPQSASAPRCAPVGVGVVVQKKSANARLETSAHRFGFFRCRVSHSLRNALGLASTINLLARVHRLRCHNPGDRVQRNVGLARSIVRTPRPGGTRNPATAPTADVGRKRASHSGGPQS